MGDDTPPMLQFTAGNGLASELQPAQPADLLPPWPPSRPLTITTAAADPLGGDLVMPMAGAKRPDGDVLLAPHFTAARDDLTIGRQPAQPGDPPRPPPQPLTSFAAVAPLGGDRDAPLGGDERPVDNSSPALQFAALCACTATEPRPTLPTDRPRPPSQPFTTNPDTAPLGGDMAAPLGGDDRPVGNVPMGRQPPLLTTASDAPAPVRHPAQPTASPRPPPQSPTTTTPAHDPLGGDPSAVADWTSTVTSVRHRIATLATTPAPPPTDWPLRGKPLAARGKPGTRSAWEQGIGLGHSANTAANVTNLNTLITLCSDPACTALVQVNAVVRAARGTFDGNLTTASACLARRHSRHFDAARFIQRQIGRVEGILDGEAFLVEPPTSLLQATVRQLSPQNTATALQLALDAALAELPRARSLSHLVHSFIPPPSATAPTTTADKTMVRL